MAAVVESLEREMELLCVTGVEDQLQADVRPTLELLRNAGIKVCSLLSYTTVFVVSNICSLWFVYIFSAVFISDLDVDRRQVGDGYLHSQKLSSSVQKSEYTRLQTGLYSI